MGRERSRIDLNRSLSGTRVVRTGLILARWGTCLKLVVGPLGLKRPNKHGVQDLTALRPALHILPSVQLAPSARVVRSFWGTSL
jgi:hypothetical protein